MYAMDDATGLGDIHSGSFNSPVAAGRTGDGWTSTSPPSASAIRASARSPFARMLRFLSTPTMSSGDGETGGLLSGVKKGTKWYDPKTFRHDSDDDVGVKAAHSDKAPAAPLLTDNGPKVDDVEMVGMGALPTDQQDDSTDHLEGDALRLSDFGPSDQHPTESLIESVNTQLWRASMTASSLAAAGDGETPMTSPANATPAGSYAGMTVLNERMAVLARAEELESSKVARRQLARQWTRLAMDEPDLTGHEASSGLTH
eukprot:scaffold113621_cov21-Prasinocladus_malaysianus.AAC.1